MEITLRTGDKIKNLSILNTYAPDMRNNEDGREKYWESPDSFIPKIQKNNIHIWRTDNNGQVATCGGNKDFVGKWTIARKTDAGNGKQHGEFSHTYNYVCSNPYVVPKQNNKENLDTRHNYDGAIEKQIAYCMISKLHRNWIINIDNKQVAGTRNSTQNAKNTNTN